MDQPAEITAPINHVGEALDAHRFAWAAYVDAAKRADADRYTFQREAAFQKGVFAYHATYDRATR